MRLHVQARPEGCILFNTFKSFVYNICPISLLRQAIRVPLPLFWSWTSTETFYQVNEDSSGSITPNKFSNYCVPRRHVTDWPNITGSPNVQRHYNPHISTACLCFQSKEIILNSHTENRVSRGASRFNLYDFVFTERESVESSRTMPRDYSENPSINFKVIKTGRSFVFHNLGSIASANKFLISATATDKSIEVTGHTT